ncbi:MAG: NAD-dependent epimerase/dehydratase family protein [Chthoniobacterales bacterium]
MRRPIPSQHRIAITGGRGRLAGLVAAFLRERGFEVTLFSRVGSDEFCALEELLQSSAMAEYRAILHMAWSSVPFTSEQDPGCEEREDLPLLKKILLTLSSLNSNSLEDLITSNAESPVTTLAFPRLIFLSSASVYGNTSEIAVTETSSCQPLSGYARAKLAAEKIIFEDAALHSSFNALILRVSNVIGFSSDPKRPQGILPRIFAAAREKQALEIWGDGCCSKDYLWIDDFLTALEAAITEPIRGIFNIASGQNFSISDLVLLVEQSCKSHVNVTYRPRYAWDVAIAHIDATAFSKATGWCAKVNVEKAIKEGKK